jgi:uncharacterized membrane protein
LRKEGSKEMEDYENLLISIVQIDCLNRSVITIIEIIVSVITIIEIIVSAIKIVISYFGHGKYGT